MANATKQPVGHVVWLLGLSGAGKSTLGNALTEDLRCQRRPVLRLDGDLLRTGLCEGLGFSDSDRTENLRRAAEVAKIGVQSGLIVVASFITPIETQRRLVRQIVGDAYISMVYLNASLSVCRARDVKGLYARATTGAVSNMTGITSSFEPPSMSDLVIDSGSEDLEQSLSRLNAFVLRKLTFGIEQGDALHLEHLG